MNKPRRKLSTAVAYTPAWKGPVEGFVVNHLRRNFWRVQSYMEYEDAMQEALVVFCKLKNRYGDMDAPAHFMALYVSSWTRRFDTLSIKSTKHRTDPLSDAGADGELAYEPVGEVENDGMLAVMVANAPAEVKAVLHLFISAPVEVLDKVSAAWKGNGRKKEYANRHLCEALGIAEGVDIVGEVHRYFE